MIIIPSFVIVGFAYNIATLYLGLVLYSFGKKSRKYAFNYHQVNFTQTWKVLFKNHVVDNSVMFAVAKDW